MLYFVTSNKVKVDNARIHLDKENISFEVKKLPLVEIQSTSIEDIAKEKAVQAFKLLNKPLVVKDDGWFIHSLNGFPGPYMKYVNEWFSINDYLNLLKEKADKSVTFHEVIYYIDENQEKLFMDQIEGTVLDNPKGHDLPFSEICTFRKDRKTVAECINEGIEACDNRRIWNDFATWYKTFSA